MRHFSDCSHPLTSLWPGGPVDQCKKYTNLVNRSVAILVGRKPRVIKFRGHVRNLGTPVKYRKYLDLDPADLENT
eukprot:SAG11_NODE_584_length_8351_cov_159.783568_4_plen_75_part_00